MASRRTSPTSLLCRVVGLTNGTALRSALAEYEATGDHDHGRGPIAPGGPCGSGDDCWVRRAREVLAIMDGTKGHEVL